MQHEAFRDERAAQQLVLVSLQDAAIQGDYGVRIHALCPAFVDTPLLQSVEDEDNMGKFVKFKDDFKRSMSKFGVLQ